MIAQVHAINLEASTTSPGMSHLQIADPGVSIQSTLLLLVILWIQIIPARIVAVRGLYALVRQIVEIRAKVSFHHLPIDVDDLSI